METSYRDEVKNKVLMIKHFTLQIIINYVAIAKFEKKCNRVIMKLKL